MHPKKPQTAVIAESLAAEATREIERLLGADATQTLGDFEAAETAVRTAVLAVAARFVAERLNADHSDQHAAGLPCRCGHTARYAGRRAKTIRTALGAMTIERAYYHCASCRTGFCPRDRTLGIDETTLSPAATRMTAAAAARVSFKEASTLLDELAGLAVDPKQVERTAEALGRAIAADERRAVEPEAHRAKPTLYLGVDGTGIPVQQGRNRPAPAQAARRFGQNPRGQARRGGGRRLWCGASAGSIPLLRVRAAIGAADLAAVRGRGLGGRARDLPEVASTMRSSA